MIKSVLALYNVQLTQIGHNNTKQAQKERKDYNPCAQIITYNL